MTLVSAITDNILTDDTDDSDRIHRAYAAATPDQKAVVDDIFISLCGYSLETLIKENPPEDEEEPDNIDDLEMDLRRREKLEDDDL